MNLTKVEIQKQTYDSEYVNQDFNSGMFVVPTENGNIETGGLHIRLVEGILPDPTSPDGNKAKLPFEVYPTGTGSYILLPIMIIDEDNNEYPHILQLFPASAIMLFDSLPVNSSGGYTGESFWLLATKFEKKDKTMGVSIALSRTQHIAQKLPFRHSASERKELDVAEMGYRLLHKPQTSRGI